MGTWRSQSGETNWTKGKFVGKQCPCSTHLSETWYVTDCSAIGSQPYDFRCWISSRRTLERRTCAVREIDFIRRLLDERRAHGVIFCSHVISYNAWKQKNKTKTNKYRASRTESKYLHIMREFKYKKLIMAGIPGVTSRTHVNFSVLFPQWNCAIIWRDAR